MQVLEIAFWLVGVYAILLLLLELVIWKVQPSMENEVTLFVNNDNSVAARKLYGFELDGSLYVSSNHWFRKWYYAVIENPFVDVERSGEIKSYKAIPLEGKERERIANAYQMNLLLRLMCGFAPRHFLRLDLHGVGVGDT